MTLHELKTLKETFEQDGRQATGVRLTADQAADCRWELHQLYGYDPGEYLTPLYGLEIVSIQAETLQFDT